MGIPVSGMRIVNDEELFDLYYRKMGPAGSGLKVQKYLTSKGVFNKSLNKPISTAGIWGSINRYLVRNYQNPEIKNTVNKYYIDCGVDPMTDEEWLVTVSKKAKTCFSLLQYRNFVRKHPDLPDYS